MSYTRSYQERIAVHYSGTVSVSYPASEHGGTKTAHYSGTTYENVNVNIHVDTNPFDRSVAGCNANVSALTGAVIATEAAQIKSIHDNSQKVANTIVSGFFDYIRSDISQQIMELAQKIDAHLLHLRELAQTCIGKQKQMEVDYNRISGRYLKIFDDLNRELENRIFALDEPAFKFKRNADKHGNRISESDCIGIATVFNKEGGGLQARISASQIKRRAFGTINKANFFLSKQKEVLTTINNSMLKENVANTRFTPICFVESSLEKNQLSRQVHMPEFLPNIQTNDLVEKFKAFNWKHGSELHQENIRRYFNIEIRNKFTASSKREERVKLMLDHLFQLSAIQFV